MQTAQRDRQIVRQIDRQIEREREKERKGERRTKKDREAWIDMQIEIKKLRYSKWRRENENVYIQFES